MPIHTMPRPARATAPRGRADYIWEMVAPNFKFIDGNERQAKEWVVPRGSACAKNVFRGLIQSHSAPGLEIVEPSPLALRC